MDPAMQVDVLCVGSHPDDVEVGIGGIVCKLTRHGYRVAILDLTRGEMSTRGSVEERRAEAETAARILGVTCRENAELPDGEVANTTKYQRCLVPFLRRLRPRILLAPFGQDRHPDHEAAHDLVRDANYFAGLARIETDAAPHRASSIYYYRVYGEPTPPQCVVDVSDDFETKLEALRAYQSQFYNPEYEASPTFVASEAFWESIRTKAAYWGSRVGVAYGEPLYTTDPVRLTFPPGLEGTR